MELGQLSLFTEDTLASLLVLPGSDKAKKMTVTSGRKYSDLLNQSDPVGLLEKMLLGTSLWGSTMCLLTWKRATTPQKRLFFRLQPSVPHTEGTEFSLWPTPHSNCHTGAGEKGEGGMNIQTAVKMWPTPRANDSEKRGKVANDLRNGLPAAVLWGTPTASSWKGSSMHGSKRWEEEIRRGNIKGQVMEPNNKGQLNPDWVECLMGFPLGWTALDGQQEEDKHSMNGNRQE